MQDEFTQAKKLEAAVEVRTHKEKITAALALLRKPPAPPEKVEAPPMIKLAPIPEDQRIFSINDPRTDGELVTAGTIDGFSLRFDESDGRRVKWVSASLECLGGVADQWNAVWTGRKSKLGGIQFPAQDGKGF